MTNPTFDKAQALAELGFQVVPWTQTSNGKTYNAKWAEVRITKETPQLIETYFKFTVRDGVAVVHPNVGIIDVDVKNGKDGYASLAALGYELPETFSYETASGGAHYYYRFPNGVTSWDNYDGLTGIDRKVANGLAHYYGEPMTQEQFDLLPFAPEWATKTKEVKEVQPPIENVAAWFDSLPEGEFSPTVASILSRIGATIDHADMVRLQYALLSEAVNGAVGVKEALSILKSVYLRDEFNTPEYQTEWTNALQGAISKLPMPKEVLSEEDEMLAEAQELARKWKITDLAKRLRAEEFAIGTRQYSWSELEAMKVDWIIDGVLAFNNNSMLVGAPNIGKTFLYIDWMCASIAGLNWAGRETKKAKFMVVIGEGMTGWSDRVKAWCAENMEDFDTIKQGIIPMSTASLASDTDIDLMATIAKNEGVDMVIFDTWNTSSGLVDENSNGEASLSLNALARMKTAVLIIHHPNAETQHSDNLKARGATAVQGKMDFVITMFQANKDKEYDAADNKYIAVSTLDKNGGKSRHSERFSLAGLYLKDAVLPDGEKTKVMVHDGADLYSNINLFFSTALKDGPKSLQEIIDWAEDNWMDKGKSGVSEKTVRNWKKLADPRCLTVTKGEKNKSIFTWTEAPLTWTPHN
jgi:hypothetical protein